MSFNHKSIFIFCLLLFFLLFIVNAAYSGEAKLADASSPYVAMHANDKVKWLEWNAETLKKSRDENKPIFLSIGYFSCYWCHVLQRESFNDDAFAKRINKSFIPVIVDRELHPSLDAYLTRFSEETTGRGGWPLNVILTPEGYPLVATIYLPVVDFTRWINNVADLWIKDANYLRNVAEEAAEEMVSVAVMPIQAEQADKKQSLLHVELGSKIVHQFVIEALSVADEFQGGFGDQAKFPLVPILQSLLKIYADDEPSKSLRLDQKKQLGDFLQLTLKSMRTRGLFDHLNGGFFRYTTGPDWQLPHFEKMLYDNAQLASLYFYAGNIFNAKSYTQTATELLDYLLDDFQNIHGGFYASYSAVDGAGIEGGYYVWQIDDIKKLLSIDEVNVAMLMWEWEKPPLLEEGFFPVPQKTATSVATQLKMPLNKVNQLLVSAKNKMRLMQEQRTLPRDNKMLASWNALMLLALLDGYDATGFIRFKQSADKLVVDITEKLYSDGILYRSYLNQTHAGKAGLEDYAYVAMALYRWSQLGQGRTKMKALSLQLANIAWMRFWTPSGWKTSDNMLIPNLSHEAMIADGPLPSPSSMLIKFGLLVEDKKLMALSKQALQYGQHSLKTTPFWYASQVGIIADMIEMTAKK